MKLPQYIFIFLSVFITICICAMEMPRSYEERSHLASNPVTKKLFNIINTKQTNLAVAADVSTKAELLALADAVGSEICLLKTHIDIIKDFDWDLIERLQSIAQKHNFLIVEDRKFADIGSTMQQQYAGGIYRIVEWADIIIAHAIAGPESIEALIKTARQYSSYERGMLLIAQLSSKKNLIDQTYTRSVLEIAQQFKQHVIGFIAQESLDKNSCFLTCTPGVNISQTHDTLGQQYNTPEHAITKHGSDVIIVGRAIYQAEDPKAAAEQYKMCAWKAYLERIKYVYSFSEGKLCKKYIH